MTDTRALADVVQSQLDRAWNDVLSTESGRAVIWSILQGTYLFDQTHGGDAMDGFRAGQRQVGLLILRNHVMPAGLDMLLRLQTEAAERESRARLVVKPEDNSDKDFLNE